MRKLRNALLAVLAVTVLAYPAAAIGGGAEQFVITLVDEPAPWEFDDPCTGAAVHGMALENGVVRMTDLGDQGLHLRIDVRGVVDLYDEDDDFVGTWTYRLHFGNQFPPGGQGADHMTASGPLEYADGSTAIVHVFHSHVFAKGDIEKRVRDWARCGGKN